MRTKRMTTRMRRTRKMTNLPHQRKQADKLVTNSLLLQVPNLVLVPLLNPNNRSASNNKMLSFYNKEGTLNKTKNLIEREEEKRGKRMPYGDASRSGSVAFIKLALAGGVFFL
jgi:hypothetical protein